MHHAGCRLAICMAIPLLELPHIVLSLGQRLLQVQHARFSLHVRRLQFQGKVCYLCLPLLQLHTARLHSNRCKGDVAGNSDVPQQQQQALAFVCLPAAQQHILFGELCAVTMVPVRLRHSC